MARVFNFSAGPSVLPEPVLEQVAAELLDHHGSGMSVTEMSHRSPQFEAILADTDARLRRLVGIPETYAVLYLQGGATLQFAMVPANLWHPRGSADYLISGHFSAKAYEEAVRVGAMVRVAGTTADQHFRRVPTPDELTLDPGADYVHFCLNNTIYGSRWPYLPDVGDVPLVGDLSSCILSEPLDVTRYGLIYAGAQKNIAPAGLTVVIVRRDLLHDPLPGTPAMLNYSLMADNTSLYNTPNCFSIYVAGLVLQWIEDLGGLPAMAARNQSKAQLLYDYLDRQDFYTAHIERAHRSWMNVTFTTPTPDLDSAFAREAEAAGLTNLRGHRVTGGIRVSLYNAMPVAGVERLLQFMDDFARLRRP